MWHCHIVNSGGVGSGTCIATPFHMPVYLGRTAAVATAALWLLATGCGHLCGYSAGPNVCDPRSVDRRRKRRLPPLGRAQLQCSRCVVALTAKLAFSSVDVLLTLMSCQQWRRLEWVLAEQRRSSCPCTWAGPRASLGCTVDVARGCRHLCGCNAGWHGDSVVSAQGSSGAKPPLQCHLHAAINKECAVQPGVQVGTARICHVRSSQPGLVIFAEKSLQNWSYQTCLGGLDHLRLVGLWGELPNGPTVARE